MGGGFVGVEYGGNQADHFVGVVSVDAVLDDAARNSGGFEYCAVTVWAVTESACFLSGWALDLGMEEH